MPTLPYYDPGDDTLKQITLTLGEFSERILYLALARDTSPQYPHRLALADRYGRFRDVNGDPYAVDGRVTTTVANSILQQINQYRQSNNDTFRRHTQLVVVDAQGNETYDGYADFPKLNFYQANYLDGDQVVVEYWGDFLFRTTRASFEASGLDFEKRGIDFDRMAKIFKRVINLAENAPTVEDLPANLTLHEYVAIAAIQAYDGTQAFERYVLDR